MQRDLATANVDVSFAEREEKQHTEESCSGGLIDSADRGHGEAHDESGHADDPSTDEERSPDDAMCPKVARTEICAELKWRQKKEKHARKNVDEREQRVAIEGVVEITESSGDGIGCGRGRTVAVEKRGRERDDAPDYDCAADEGQEGERGPESATES